MRTPRGNMNWGTHEETRKYSKGKGGKERETTDVGGTYCWICPEIRLDKKGHVSGLIFGLSTPLFTDG